MILSNVDFPVSWDDNAKTAFTSSVMPMINDAYGAEASALVEDVLNIFCDGLEATADVIEMIVSFKSWFAENAQIFKVDGNHPNVVTVTVTAPAGAGTISIALGAPCVDENGITLNSTARKVTVARLVKYGVEHMQQIGGMFPKSEQPAQPSTMNPDDKGIIERHQASAISIKVDGGKKYYRVRAAWFVKFGAPIYPETLESAGLGKYVNMEAGEYPFLFPVDAQVKEVGGKKQVKIVKVLTPGA